MTDLFTEKGADISGCGKYRYRLWRRWNSSQPSCVFIMLNPSTADYELDDPTIRRCVGFAWRENCGGIQVVNLFAFRATDPAQLRDYSDPIGRRNDEHIDTVTNTAMGPIILAWGTHGALRNRDIAVLERLKNLPLKCLGMTKGGNPKHPLYLPKDSPLVDFRP